MTALEELVEKTKEGDVFAAARLITLIQRKDEEAEKLVSEFPNLAKDTLLIGITGPGGVGKSTLINKLIHFFTKEGKTIGVMCCDPASISGGAFLGDRVRMQEHSGNPGVFIRSLAQYENIKGVAPEVPYVVKIFGVLKKEVIIIETVGAGQENLGFKDQVEILVFILAPGFGDEIQLLKGGVIETADIIVLNKVDKPEAELSFQRLIRNFEGKKIYKTNSESGEGISELAEGIKELKNFSKGGKEWTSNYKKNKRWSGIWQKVLSIMKSGLRLKNTKKKKPSPGR